MIIVLKIKLDMHATKDKSELVSPSSTQGSMFYVDAGRNRQRLGN